MASDSPQDDDEPGLSPLTWVGSDRRLARRVARPMLRFLRIEAAGGIVMLLAAAVALVWANSPWDHSYHDLLETHVRITFVSIVEIDEPL